jgi:hypothetical protein
MNSVFFYTSKSEFRHPKSGIDYSHTPVLRSFTCARARKPRLKKRRSVWECHRTPRDVCSTCTDGSSAS